MYLNDHNKAVEFYNSGLRPEDFEMLDRHHIGIRQGSCPGYPLLGSTIYTSNNFNKNQFYYEKNFISVARGRFHAGADEFCSKDDDGRDLI